MERFLDKFFNVLGLALFFSVTTLLVSEYVAHSAQSGTLTLNGVVAENTSLTVTDDGVTVDLTVGATALQVGSVFETCNKLTGYTVLAKSLNAGYKSGTNVVPFRISYDNQSEVTMTQTDTVVKTVPSLTGLTTHSSPVKISVSASPNLPMGSYTDTIIFTIQAN